jgi:hypothetical protein
VPPRYFTRAEAVATLEIVRPLAERLVRHRRLAVEAQAKRNALALRVAGNGGGLAPRDLADLDEQIAVELQGIARCVNAIHEVGAVVKDADSGLVDFPARIEGAEAYLCWQVGEDGIDYWHGIEEGFSGRKALDP